MSPWKRGSAKDEGSPERDGSKKKSRFDGFSRRAQVILALVGALVAIVTGMVALADRVVPEHQAVAMSVPAYQQSIDEVCDELNDHEEDRAESLGLMAKRFARARTTPAQRDAAQSTTQLILNNSKHDLEMFQALVPPGLLADTAKRSIVAWKRSLERIGDYLHRLDLVDTFADADAAAEHNSATKVAGARDETITRSGLVELGGGRCRLEEQAAVPPIRFTNFEAASKDGPSPSVQPSHPNQQGGTGDTTPDGTTSAGASPDSSTDAGPDDSADASPDDPADESADDSPGEGPESSPDASPDVTPAPTPTQTTPSPDTDAKGPGPGPGSGPGTAGDN